MNPLSVQHLTVRFGAVTALSDVTLDVLPGELFAVIGPNGAGKTSLFNAVTRVYQPSQGTLQYFGADMARWRPHHLAGRGIARTFQNLGLFPTLSVLDNVLIGRGHLMRVGVLRAGLRLPGSRRAQHEHAEAARAAIDFVGLGAAAALPVGALPYGRRKRVELARALAMEPRLLLLDEPVAGTSRAERAETVALIEAIRRQRDITIMLVEHDMGVVMSLADRVLVLDFGKPVALGPPGDVQRDPRVIAAYLGEVSDAGQVRPA